MKTTHLHHLEHSDFEISLHRIVRPVFEKNGPIWAKMR